MIYLFSYNSFGFFFFCLLSHTQKPFHLDCIPYECVYACSCCCCCFHHTKRDIIAVIFLHLFFCCWCIWFVVVFFFWSYASFWFNGTHIEFWRVQNSNVYILYVTFEYLGVLFFSSPPIRLLWFDGKLCISIKCFILKEYVVTGNG